MNDIIGMTYTDQVDIVEQLPEGYRCKDEKVIDLLNHLKENTTPIEEQNELKKDYRLRFERNKKSTWDRRRR